MAQGTLMAVCASKERTEPKTDIGSGELRAGYGLVGDAHAGFSGREVSIMAYESILRARNEFGIDARPGCFADNFAIQGVNFSEIRVGDQIQIGPALLEIVQIGKPPDVPHTYDFHGVSLLREEGLFCRVIRGGHVQRGDPVKHIPIGGDASHSTPNPWEQTP
jgi:molybdopterin adenylyltransferase